MHWGLVCFAKSSLISERPQQEIPNRFFAGVGVQATGALDAVIFDDVLDDAEFRSVRGDVPAICPSFD